MQAALARLMTGFTASASQGRSILRFWSFDSSFLSPLAYGVTVDTQAWALFSGSSSCPLVLIGYWSSACSGFYCVDMKGFPDRVRDLTSVRSSIGITKFMSILFGDVVIASLKLWELRWEEFIPRAESMIFETRRFTRSKIPNPPPPPLF